MLPPHVESLIDNIRRKHSFEITVRTYDGAGYASLGHDLMGLDTVLECVRVAEVAAAYWTFPFGAFNTYSLHALMDFEAIISRPSPSTWVDAFSNQDHWLDVYGRVQSRRGGYWAVGDGEILRVEFIDLYKENPTVKKILVTGFLAAQIFLAGCFGGVQLIKEGDAEQCRQEYIDYGQHLSEAVFQQARLEGRLTEQHLKALEAIQTTVNTGTAACGSKLDKFQVGVKVNESGVDLGLTVTAGNAPKNRHP